MTDIARNIARKIEQRAYQSPGRARGAVSRSQLRAAAKRKLGEAITRWESEGSTEPPVVGGLPAETNGTEDDLPVVHVADFLDGNGHAGHLHLGATPDVPSRASLRAEGPFTLPLRLNLNCRVRARLTPFGVHVLYAARAKVPVPENLLSNCAVWETTLAHFMIVFGDHLQGPDNDVPVCGFELELYQLRP